MKTVLIGMTTIHLGLEAILVPPPEFLVPLLSILDPSHIGNYKVGDNTKVKRQHDGVATKFHLCIGEKLFQKFTFNV